MSWWTKAVGFVFGSPKALEDVTETGGKIATGLMQGLDHLHFGEQERAEFSQKGAEIVLKYWDKVREENSEQSKARRQLAVKIITFFIRILWLAIGCRVGGIWYVPLVEVSTFILSIALSGIVGGLVISIGTIYFGPQQLSKIVDFRKK